MAGPRAKATELPDPPWPSEKIGPWPPESPDPPWPPEFPDPPWPPESPDPPWRSLQYPVRHRPPGCPPPLPGRTVTARDSPTGRGAICHLNPQFAGKFLSPFTASPELPCTGDRRRRSRLTQARHSREITPPFAAHPDPPFAGNGSAVKMVPPSPSFPLVPSSSALPERPREFALPEMGPAPLPGRTVTARDLPTGRGAICHVCVP